jgi:hypothetical protein
VVGAGVAGAGERGTLVEMRNVVAIHEPSSCFVPAPLTRRPSLASAKTAGSRSLVILVSEVTLTVVSAVLPFKVSIIPVGSTAVMVPAKPRALMRGAAFVEVESDWALAGRAANAMAVRRTSESFVIDFITLFIVLYSLYYTGLYG